MALNTNNIQLGTGGHVRCATPYSIGEETWPPVGTLDGRQRRSLTGGRALQRCPFLEGAGQREPRRRTVFRRVRSLVEELALDAVSGRG